MSCLVEYAPGSFAARGEWLNLDGNIWHFQKCRWIWACHERDGEAFESEPEMPPELVCRDGRDTGMGRSVPSFGDVVSTGRAFAAMKRGDPVGPPGRQCGGNGTCLAARLHRVSAKCPDCGCGSFDHDTDRADEAYCLDCGEDWREMPAGLEER